MAKQSTVFGRKTNALSFWFKKGWNKVKVLVTQLCLTLCDPMDYRPPGSSVHGILQARILEWDAITFSRGIFPIQELNLALLHCRQSLTLSHQEHHQNHHKYKGTIRDKITRKTVIHTHTHTHTHTLIWLLRKREIWSQCNEMTSKHSCKNLHI